MNALTRWCVAAVILSGLLAAATTARAGISVAPSFVEVALDQGRPAGRFEIANLGDTEQRYRIKAMHFNFARNGNLERLEPDGHSLAAWIKFNPAELTIAPRSSRIVRFVIVPRGRLEPGEYWAAMELEDLNAQVGKSRDAEGHELKIEVVSTILVPIFGTVGTVRYEGTFDAFRAEADDEGTRLEALASNRGDGRLLLTGRYEVRNAGGDVVDEGPFGYAYVLPGADRSFVGHVKAPLPAGTYTVRVRYTAPQLKEPLVREATLTLTAPSVPKPPPPPAAAVAAPTTEPPRAPTAPAPPTPEPTAASSPPAEPPKP